MQPLTQRDQFAPTQPQPEYQDRLSAQRFRWRPSYTPNSVPLAERILYGLISVTWVAWAAIGLLSGHMFLLISRSGPIHLTGIPAILFSFAVTASAAALAAVIVDHYDRRDNEAAYRKTRRLLWYCAAGFLCLSALVGLAERSDLLPYTDGRLGLLSTPNLKSLLTSNQFAATLAPYRSAIDSWSMILFFGCLAGVFALYKMGLLKNEHPQRPGVVLFVALFLVRPAVAAFTLNLIATLVSDSISSRPMTDEALRAHVAWLQSMLLTSLSMLIFLCFVAVITLLRVVGILPLQGEGQTGAV